MRAGRGSAASDVLPFNPVWFLRAPAELKDKPVAVRQKHTIVTCNYVARRMGVAK